ncbi:MAG: ribonuclease H-like domain-containing protein [Lysobacter sp.]
MSVTLEKLRSLKREAGGVGLGSAVQVRATLPQLLPVRQESQASACRLPPVLAVEIARCAALFEKEDPGEICFPDARSNATAAPHSTSSNKAEGATASIEALRRLLGVRERKLMPALPRGPVDRALPGEEIAPGLRLIETHLPCPAPDAALSLAFAKRAGESVDPRDLLFFDTETTGLAGGTGTRAFMIGAADWHRDPHHGDGLRIRQLLITTLAAEPAMLRAFAGWLAPHTVLSSYNGRCYDSPLLKTRYRLARMGDPITPLDHVDLLFPTRRRYRGMWENCRLATIERELLKIVREDDLPGSEAPSAWLSYLRGGAATNLRRVAAHNHQDVVTLARLMTRLVAAQAGDAATGGVG